MWMWARDNKILAYDDAEQLSLFNYQTKLPGE